MNLFGGVIPITGISFLMFCIFIILFVGYAFGRITIKGVSLGDAGVFVVSLLFGALLIGPLESQMVIKGEIETVNFLEKALEVVEQLGLIFFVTSVGFIAGPKFFGTMKKSFKSFVLLGLVIILSGGIAAVICIGIGNVIGYGSSIETSAGFTAMISGLLAGALTSTPAFSAAKATVDPSLTSLVSVGYGIAYIFGVIGVVLFVQLMPKVVKADMDVERTKLVGREEEKSETKKIFTGTLLKLDDHGFAVFALAAVLGTIVGKLKIPLSSAGQRGHCFFISYRTVSADLPHLSSGTPKLSPESAGKPAHCRRLGAVFVAVLRLGEAIPWVFQSLWPRRGGGDDHAVAVFLSGDRTSGGAAQ